MSTGIVTRRKSAMHIDNSYGIDVVAANTNLVSKRVLKGEPFSTQIVCDAGYSIYEITIKMGGVDITSTAYDATYNMITIPSVTGDVDIECYAMHTMPSDYIRVDGIKNPSNACLSTDVQGNKYTKIELDVYVDNVDNTHYLVANKQHNYTGAYGTGFEVYNGKLYAFTNRETTLLIDNPIGRWNLFADNYKNQVGYNQVVKSFSRYNIADNFASIYLFAGNNGGFASASANDIIFSCKIFNYQTASYARYYIPCLNDSGVAGFWDAARGIFQGSSNSTAFQPVYVQDNLIAHYDGIDNAGVGVHDANATTWKDLKGSNDVVAVEETVTWESDGWISNTGSVHFGTNGNSFIISSLYDSDFTLEYVFKPYGINANSGQYSLSSNRTSADLTNYLAVSQKDLISIHAHRAGINTARNLIANNGVYSVSAVKKGNLYSVWINGIKVASGISTGSTAFYSTNSYLIGGDTNGNFKGKFYAHRVYTKALTDEEIIGNYNIDKLRFNF